MRWFLRNLRVKLWWYYLKPVPFANSGGSWCPCSSISRKLRALSNETYCFFSTALIFFSYSNSKIERIWNHSSLVPWFLRYLYRRKEENARITNFKSKVLVRNEPFLVLWFQNGSSEIKCFSILHNHYRTDRTL